MSYYMDAYSESFSYNKREAHCHNTPYDKPWGGSYAFSSIQAYHVLQNTDAKQDELDSGRKINISIHPKDIEKAWKVICNLVISNNIAQAKVANGLNASQMNQPSDTQRGKIITLYDDGKHHDWSEIIGTIESEFAAMEIEPGYDPIGDIAIKGSQYVSHRVDHSPDGKYVSASQAAAINPQQPHNPYNQATPFDAVDVSSVYDNNPSLNRMPKPTQPDIRANDLSRFQFTENTPSLTSRPHHQRQNMTMDIEKARLDVLSLPFEYGMKGGKPVLRLNLDDKSDADIIVIKKNLQKLGIGSEVAGSALNDNAATLKLDDAQTELLEKVQQDFLYDMVKKDQLQFGNTATQKNVSRINLQAVDAASSSGIGAAMETLNRMHIRDCLDKKIPITPAALEMGSSGLFPNSPDMVLKVDDDRLSKSIHEAVGASRQRETDLQERIKSSMQQMNRM